MYRIESGVSWSEPAGWSRTHRAPHQETPHDRSYAHLVHLASPAQRLRWAFTRRGFRRFAEWITAMALNVEEHTITQSVLALEQPADWKALESFAEYGGWHEGRVTCALTRLIADRPGPDLARLSRLGRR